MYVLLAISTANSAIKLIAASAVFVFVLFATYGTTRFVSNFQKKNMHGDNFDVIETYRISNSKYLQMIRIGEEYVVIAVCKDTVTMLCKVPKESIVIPEENDKDLGMKPQSFKEMFEQLKDMKNNEDKDESDEES